MSPGYHLFVYVCNKLGYMHLKPVPSTPHVEGAPCCQTLGSNGSQPIQKLQNKLN